MQEINFDEAVEQILAKDSRYHRDAYTFVREALDYTQKLVGRETRGQIRHVSGQKLLDGIRQFALQQFGPMTMTVFEEWGVRNCRDFGEIVFNMVRSACSPKPRRTAATISRTATILPTPSANHFGRHKNSTPKPSRLLIEIAGYPFPRHRVSKRLCPACICRHSMPLFEL